MLSQQAHGCEFANFIVRSRIVPNVKYPLFLPDFNEAWNSVTILKNTQIPNVIRICPVRAKFSHMDGRTDGWKDMAKLIRVVAFRNFVKASKIIRSANSFNLCVLFRSQE